MLPAAQRQSRRIKGLELKHAGIALAEVVDMKKSNTLLATLLLLPLVTSAACIEAPDDAENADGLEFNKNGNLLVRMDWIEAGKPLKLYVTCDEYFSCDVQYNVKACPDWYNFDPRIEEGIHGFASIGKISTSWEHDGLEYGQSYGPAVKTFLFEKTGANHSAQLGPEAQQYRIRDLHPKATVAAELSIPPQFDEVCVSIEVKYW